MSRVVVAKGRAEDASSGPGAAEPDRQRIRFALSVAVWGGAVGAAAVLVNFLTRAESFEVAERMSVGSSALFATSGFLGAFIMVGPAAYLMYGGRARFYSDIVRKPRGLVTWGLLGLGYGTLLPLISGAFFLPVAVDILSFRGGLMSVANLMVKAADLAAGAWISFALSLGIQLFFTGLLGAAVFALGGWLIDKLNISEDPNTANYRVWAVSVGLSLALIAAASLGPTALLRGLG